MYQLAVELKKLPSEIRSMSSTDYIRLIATLTRGQPKVIKWDQGGAGIAVAWAEAMKKKRKT